MMAWYDLFSTFYDGSVERLYAPYRVEAVEALELAPGDHVLDLACGTGPNFPYLQEAVGPEGLVIGVDFSAGMIERATTKVTNEGWDQVFAIEGDARNLDIDVLSSKVGEPVKLSGIIVSLGLSVIPQWQDVLEATFALLEPNARYVIFDIHTQRWVPTTSVVRWVAQADMSRQPWTHLESLGISCEHRYLKGSSHLHGGTPYLAVGRT